jgi:hypothetical protein
MSKEAAPSHGVMEGKGSYNKHAKLPASGAAMAMPSLEKATQRLQLDASDQPVVIADYGSSQGKNSMAPHAGCNRRSAEAHRGKPANFCVPR